ncbi:tRNA (adenine(58)-N(1))-methyltransferase catalytic subunit TRMT61A [Ischnura elegans]|uniref:tRNA (adenine(58)-N(1))-methyltransferase catalytic subunit TRMT61A n=1 Tax=Ischnura elegans TaxID=197161 RepID=UPI001ED89C60|nr:tRNA (adenine(58)-N(1))-methyltransferase catalytic subunit TRMT61A [Ischnura elegans]
MSFSGYKEFIEEGDTVILFLSVNNMYAIKAVPNIRSRKGNIVENVMQTTCGALNVRSLIGRRYGCRATLSRGGWAIPLHPTSELWTRTLPHRTQIIYTPDISLILLNLDLKPGSLVIESGTGSGSLTHALDRCVSPGGRIFSFDFHPLRVETARSEFEEHGILYNGKEGTVSVDVRDVCKEGFGMEDMVDAVFLDLPCPWDVIPHAVTSLKESGGRLCSFSPCVEQVQRTVISMDAEGFVDISTVECIQTELHVTSKVMPDVLTIPEGKKGKQRASVSKERVPDANDQNSHFLTGTTAGTQPGHTGYLTFATLPPKRIQLKQKRAKKSFD